MHPVIYTVANDGPGMISTMAKPRSGDWLEDELSGLRGLGVDVLVCLLTAAEMRELGLGGERDAARRAGLDFVWLPVEDRGIPDPTMFEPALDALEQYLDQGRHIVAHCRFGLGRASLLVAALLVRIGCSPDRAWDVISAARGERVPDTEQQRDWITRYGQGKRRAGKSAEGRRPAIEGQRRVLPTD